MSPDEIDHHIPAHGEDDPNGPSVQAIFLHAAIPWSVDLIFDRPVVADARQELCGRALATTDDRHFLYRPQVRMPPPTPASEPANLCDLPPPICGHERRPHVSRIHDPELADLQSPPRLLDRLRIRRPAGLEFTTEPDRLALPPGWRNLIQRYRQRGWRRVRGGKAPAGRPGHRGAPALSLIAFDTAQAIAVFLHNGLGDGGIQEARIHTDHAPVQGRFREQRQQGRRRPRVGRAPSPWYG